MNKVVFKTEDENLQALYDEAEKRLKGNLREFGRRPVLVEGAGYEKIWLETQPMGGEMFYKRDNSGASLNNILLFMEKQRSDGRLPGSIKCEDGILIPEYNKLQGFCFAEPAYDMYFLTEDREYLDMLAATLEKFDAWLWTNRDSDGDGCLESFCVYDTGEDGAVRYKDAPNYWDKDAPPTEYEAVPMASSDIMSWSYSARETIAKICRIKKKDAAAAKWHKQALDVRKAMEAYLWNDGRQALFDRYKNHEMQRTLTHATLKAMYWGSLSEAKANSFVKRHLLDHDEFWTAMPLPSVAANDPDFRNIPENNWSGQCEALTYQRAIRALENYGWERLLLPLGEKLFGAVGRDMAFVQQFDPFTGGASLNDVSGGQPTYGPAILSVLEYISRIYGLQRKENMIYWGFKQGPAYEYVQVLNDAEYRICHSGRIFECFLDGRLLFSAGCDGRIVTDLQGKDAKIVLSRR